MSAVIMNIVVGLITSLISGVAVWGWGRTRVSRRQRERARFFGLSPGDTCRIVAPQAFGAPRTISKHDVFSIVELAKLMRDLRADLDVVGSGEGAYGVGDCTEFCVGGPTANVRMQSHLARFLPGVSILSFTPDSPRPWLAGQVALARSRTKTGIWRAVFRWYSAYGGNAVTARCHHSARSSPVTSRAIMSHLRGPS